MANQYELTIKVVGSNGEETETNIADPFKEKENKDRQQNKIDKLVTKTAKSVAVRSATTIVRSYSQTLGNSSLTQRLEVAEGAVNAITQTIVAGTAAGPAGVIASLVAMLPNVISKSIEYSNGKTWESIGQNKN